MDKRALNDRDICTKFITPALRRASPLVTQASGSMAAMLGSGLLLLNPDNV